MPLSFREGFVGIKPIPMKGKGGEKSHTQGRGGERGKRRESCFSSISVGEKKNIWKAIYPNTEWRGELHQEKKKGCSSPLDEKFKHLISWENGRRKRFCPSSS